MSGWQLQSTALPQVGAIVDQDNWTMWAFHVINSEYYLLLSDLAKEKASDEIKGKSHEAMKKRHGIG